MMHNQYYYYVWNPHTDTPMHVLFTASDDAKAREYALKQGNAQLNDKGVPYLSKWFGTWQNI